MSAILDITNVSKTFHNESGSTHVLSELNLTVGEGDFVTVIGPSGCGKSTLLKLIAGLDTDYSGAVSIEGRKVDRPSQDKGFIFQEHRLFPWLDVAGNIAADLPLRKPEVRERVAELIRLVKLEGFEKAYPRQLSGGMSQRVAIARALLRNPKVLLLDEPFGALDAFTRAHLQDALLDIWQANRTTMVLVTHDIDEAVFLSNRVVVMDAKPGTIKAVIPIDLPYPRKRSGTAFQDIRTHLLRSLEHHESDEPSYAI